MTASCITCANYLHRGTPDAEEITRSANTVTGICRRYPPRAFSPFFSEVSGLTVTSAFPIVHPDQLCGEHRPRNEVPL